MKLVFILPLFFCSVLFAATTTDPEHKYREAKFNIIKRTIEFLSTDTMFHNVKKHECDACTDYPHLKIFAKPIDGGVGLISDWFNVTVSNYQQLQHFRDDVIKTITTGGKNNHRTRRPRFAGYGQYLSDIKQIVDATGDVTASSNTNDSTEDAQKNISPDARSSTREGRLEAEIANLQDSIRNMINAQKAHAGTILGLQTDWWFIGGLVALSLLVIYLLFKERTQRKKKEMLKRDIKLIHTQKSAIAEELTALRGASHNLRERTEAAEAKAKELEEKLANERRRNQQKGREGHEDRYQDNNNQHGRVNLSKEFRPITKYARYADKGDGFSSGDLLDASDSETIFEISITAPGTGVFSISSNRQAQKYALSNASYFLSNTCQYDTLPSANSEIITTTPGQLELNGDKWIIRYPAKISFN